MLLFAFKLRDSSAFVTKQHGCACSRLIETSELGVERLSAWPIIGADIKHFTDYRYRPFSFFIMQTNILFTGDIIYW